MPHPRTNSDYIVDWKRCNPIMPCSFVGKIATPKKKSYIRSKKRKIDIYLGEKKISGERRYLLLLLQHAS